MNIASFIFCLLRSLLLSFLLITPALSAQVDIPLSSYSMTAGHYTSYDSFFICYLQMTTAQGYAEVAGTRLFEALFLSPVDSGRSFTLSSNSDDPEYQKFVDLLTNGVDDQLILFINHAGTDQTESEMFGLSLGDGAPDLFGNRIDAISLTVNDLSFSYKYTSPCGKIYGCTEMSFSGTLSIFYSPDSVVPPTTTTTTSQTTTTSTSFPTSTTTTTIINGYLNLTLNANAGWSLLSSATGFQTTTLFGDTQKFTSVWKWTDGGTGTKTWAVYLPGGDGGVAYAQAKGFMPLTSIASGEGFWVNSTIDQQVLVSGVPVFGELSFSQGWNLVGVKGAHAMAVTDLGPVTSAWKWTTVNNGKTWAVNLPGESDKGASYAASKGFGQFNTIEPGEGYWVNKP